MNAPTKIEIGKGYGDYILGAKQDEITANNGDPDKVNDIGEESDQYVIFYYYDDQVKLYFDKSRNYRLISIEVYQPEAFLLNKKVINEREKVLRSILFDNNVKYDVEEYPGFHVIYIPKMQVYINVEMDHVRSIEVQPLLKNEKIIWPEA